MDKQDKKTIYFLLIIAIVLSSILLKKIYSKTDYDKELYNNIYNEYEQILTSNIEEENNNEIDNKVIGGIKISKINIEYPILSKETEEYLKIAPTKLLGPEPNKDGNLCIIGHNYRNGKMFSNLNKLEIGDLVEITNVKNYKLIYEVYEKYEVLDIDWSCTNQETNGKREITLITCTNSKNKRLILKCVENSIK